MLFLPNIILFCSIAQVAISVLVPSISKTDILTDNFFENLLSDPSLEDDDLSEHSKKFIDVQIQNYLNLKYKTPNYSSDKKSKRSISIPKKMQQDSRGVYILDSLKAIGNIPVLSSEGVHIELFEQNNGSYAMVLENLDVVFYKNVNEKFEEVLKDHIGNTESYHLFSDNQTYFAKYFENEIRINIFTNDEKLEKIQTIAAGSTVLDLKIWNLNQKLFMAVVEKNLVKIYEWLGTHFDKVQTIEANSREIQSFKIKNNHYLALAEHQNSDYSEIYKLDYNTQKFKLHQKIRTESCKDITYFEFTEENQFSESFLIIANNYKLNVTDSILYKFVDDYFIPLQNFVMDNLVEWIPVKGHNNEVVLMAKTKGEIKIFFYNGWTFEEQKIDFNFENVGFIKADTFLHQPALILIKKGTQQNVFGVEFNNQKPLKDLQDNLLYWCQQSIETIENFEVPNKTKREVKNRSDVDEHHDENIATEILSLNNEIKILEEKVSNSLQSEKLHIVNDLKATNVFLSKNSILNNLSSKIINEINIREVLNSTIDIISPLVVNEISLQSITIDSDVTPDNINGRTSNKLLHINDDININHLEADSVNTPGVVVNGLLNGVNVDPGSIMLNTGDQQIQNLNASKITVNNFETSDANRLNNFLINEINNANTDSTVNVAQLETLKVKNLVVGGFINNVYMPTIDKFALRTNGNQILTDTYYFDAINVDDVDATKVNGHKSNEFVKINQGHYKINEDVQFSQDTLVVNELQVSDFLDNMPVQNRRLQVLMKHSDVEQHVTSVKQIERLTLLKALNLRGKIDNIQMEKYNPVVNIFNEISIAGDFTISGPTIVENSLVTDDITSKNGAQSLRKLNEKGVLLSERNIQNHLNFSQQLVVNDIFLDKINEQSPNNWVVLGTNETQFIQGSKVFNGDLTVSGPTNVFKVNNIDVQELELTVLRRNGDQIISGEHFIQDVVAKNVTGEETFFGKNSIDTILQSNKEQIITGTATFRNLEATTCNFTKMENNNLKINNEHFNDLIMDTVQNNNINTRPILGHKTFKTLETVNIEIPQSIIIDEPEVTIVSNLKLKNLKVENIVFENTMNGLEKEPFSELNTKKIEIVQSNQNLEKLTVLGEVKIESGFINDVNVSDFVLNSLKLDEEIILDNITFETELQSLVPITLSGDIIGVDLENIVTSHSKEKQIVVDLKNFESNIFVNGTTHFNGLINNFNYSRMCTFAKIDESNKKNLFIEGNAMFTKAVDVKKINNIPIDPILENAWYKNKETNLTGYFGFNNADFKKEINVTGKVDNVNLQKLFENYVSKTKNQTISAKLNFLDEIYFVQNLITPEINIKGLVNNVKVEEFFENVLLEDEDQIFENMIYFENVTADQLEGEYLVNSLNLETDVMRYDKANVVTGKKNIADLTINQIELRKNISIQNVDIGKFMENVVLRNGNSNIRAKKIIRGDVEFLNDVSLQGFVNGKPFTPKTVMLKSIPQNVTGQITIKSTPIDPVVFKTLKIKNLVNGVDVTTMMQNQAVKNKDNDVYTKMVFNKDIKTTNLNMVSTFNGVNITEFLANVTDLENLNNIQENYQKLLDISVQQAEALKHQAYYLDYYKVIQEIYGPEFGMSIPCVDKTCELVTMTNQNSKCVTQFYRWNETDAVFVDTSMETAEYDWPNSQTVLNMAGSQFLYSKYDTDIEHLYELDCAFKMDTYATFKLKSNYVNAFSFKSFNCLLVIEEQTLSTDIICQDMEEDNDRFVLHQSINTTGAIKAYPTKIKEDLYLLIVTKNANNKDGSVEIWKMNQNNQFGLEQVLFVPKPENVATISHENVHYMAVISGQMQETLLGGHIDIKRFNEETKKFVPWHEIQVNAPEQIEFSVLPTNELVLYVLTNNPTEPLIVYMHNGIAGFTKKIVASSIPNLKSISQFNINNKHFLMGQGENKVVLLQAFFKGEGN